MIRAALTVEDARAGMRALAPQIERYAKLIVEKGVNVKPGQELVVSAPVESAAFVRLLVRCGYEAGAGHVTVIWSDDEVGRLTYEHVDTSYFETTPEWQRVQLDSLAQMGACFLFVEGSDPEALRGMCAPYSTSMYPAFAAAMSRPSSTLSAKQKGLCMPRVFL